MIFYLGTHRPEWLAYAGVPLFVSRRRLADRRTCPRANSRWALDSGGFSELSIEGRWTIPPIRYVLEVARWAEEIGMLDWAATMDWMCEPQVLAKTGLTVREHQRRTVANYLDLRHWAPSLPWVPVVQGWHFDEYLECLSMYAEAGVDLAALPRVGVGSICRREDTDAAEAVIRAVASRGIRVHCFGLKIRGARRVADAVASSDSMAWSYGARRKPSLEGCVGHKNCANCLRYALKWRGEVVRAMGEHHEVT